LNGFDFQVISFVRVRIAVSFPWLSRKLGGTLLNRIISKGGKERYSVGSRSLALSLPAERYADLARPEIMIYKSPGSN
jgi:hypothetical protein